jgi:hypothetical protein
MRQITDERFEVLSAVRMMMIFWVVMPQRPVGRYQCFGETYCLYLQAEVEDNMFLCNIGFCL